jgi:hypothetical protein
MEMLADGSALVGRWEVLQLNALRSHSLVSTNSLVDHADDMSARQCRILNGRSGESFGPARMAKAHHYTARNMDVDDDCVMLFLRRYKAEGGKALADMWHARRLEMVRYTASNWTRRAREEWKKCQPRRIGKGKSPAGSGASPPLHRVDKLKAIDDIPLNPCECEYLSLSTH